MEGIRFGDDSTGKKMGVLCSEARIDPFALGHWIVGSD
jgi:hypothetical protein